MTGVLEVLESQINILELACMAVAHFLAVQDFVLSDKAHPTLHYFDLHLLPLRVQTG
jgi:hypothetical protein